MKKLTLQSALCLLCTIPVTNLLADINKMPAPDAPPPSQYYPGKMLAPPPDRPAPASSGTVYKPVTSSADILNAPIDHSVLYIQRGGVSGENRHRLEEFISRRFGKRIRYMDAPVLYVRSDDMNSDEQSELMSYAKYELGIKVEFLSGSNQ